MALAYAERLRQEKIQMYEDGLAKGGFLPYVAGWCGRPDLAKASTKRDFVGPRYWDRTNFLAIVPHRDRTGQGEDVSEEEMIRRRLAAGICEICCARGISVPKITPGRVHFREDPNVNPIGAVFPPDLIQRMKAVLDDATAALPESKRTSAIKAEMACSILAAAAKGERNSEVLRTLAIGSLVDRSHYSHDISPERRVI
jgi:hypothetical protein